MKKYTYRVFGISPEVPAGLEFYSDIASLGQKQELWPTECPFYIPDDLRESGDVWITDATPL